MPDIFCTIYVFLSFSAANSFGNIASALVSWLEIFFVSLMKDGSGKKGTENCLKMACCGRGREE